MSDQVADSQAPLLARTDQRDRAGFMHGVPVDGRRLVDHARPGLDGAPAEVGVLARGFPEGLVEAIEAFEQFARVGDVARLEPGPRAGRVLRAGEGREPPDLTRV